MPDPEADKSWWPSGTWLGASRVGDPREEGKPAPPPPSPRWGWSLILVFRGRACKTDAMEQQLLVFKGRPVLPKPGQIC